METSYSYKEEEGQKGWEEERKLRNTRYFDVIDTIFLGRYR
jgi:hypothetical protein